MQLPSEVAEWLHPHLSVRHQGDAFRCDISGDKHYHRRRSPWIYREAREPRMDSLLRAGVDELDRGEGPGRQLPIKKVD